jgi:hypothetical protein
MKVTALTQQPDYATLRRHPEQGTVLCHVPFRTADAARSAKNISLWNSYLPTTCVRTMVRMGWDYTT